VAEGLVIDVGVEITTQSWGSFTGRLVGKDHFEVLTVVFKILMFCDVAPYQLVNIYLSMQYHS
jgi:hypothetical protein